ncbi:hypothetical protein B0H10DRAFT_1940577 [Mycena sp. CBHHK59/15]|nr:hypothetical protein B0H10DRAFT_1940577 [Mycena sp. CBHHK59/15]
MGGSVTLLLYTCSSLLWCSATVTEGDPASGSNVLLHQLEATLDGSQKTHPECIWGRVAHDMRWIVHWGTLGQDWMEDSGSNQGVFDDIMARWTGMDTSHISEEFLEALHKALVDELSSQEQQKHVDRWQHRDTIERCVLGFTGQVETMTDMYIGWAPMQGQDGIDSKPMELDRIDSDPIAPSEPLASNLPNFDKFYCIKVVDLQFLLYRGN